MNLSDYVIIDTETNGLPPGHLPWEIAMIHRSTDTSVWVHQVIHITDFDASTMTDQAAAVNGFYERWMMLDSAGKQMASWMTTAEAVECVERWTIGKRIVGSKPSFDIDALINLGCNPVWQHHPRDLPSMFLGAYGYDVRGLEGVLAALEIENDAPHTALGDAWAAAQAFVQILADAAHKAVVV